MSALTPEQQEAAERAIDALNKALEARDLAEQAEADLVKAIKALGGTADTAEARKEWIKMRKRIQAALRAADTEAESDDD